MKNITFSCFNGFKCSADKCKHNCCVGWEIFIDKRTLNKYKKLTTTVSLPDAIDYNSSKFVLNKNKRCPFLDKKNLCEIIIEEGEKNLCKICKEHPRFRNCFYDRTETGFGLCCEQAVKMCLSADSFDEITADDIKPLKKHNEIDVTVLSYRSELLKIAKDGSLTIYDKLSTILRYMSIKNEIDFSGIFFKNLVNSMEYMDEAFKSKLLKINKSRTLSISDLHSLYIDFKFLHSFNQFFIYCIYRHVSKAKNVDDLKTYTLMCCFFVILVLSLFALKGNSSSFDDLCECVREFSAEIEYSDKNMELFYDYCNLIIYMSK